MNLKMTFFSISLLFVNSCSNNKNQNIWKPMNEPSSPLSELEYLVLEKGDTNAYIELDIAYMDLEHGKFFKFAKVMADEYDYTQAYFDVYFQTLKSTKREGAMLSLDSCSFAEKKLAIKYLELAQKKNHLQANDEIEELKHDGFIE